MKQITSPTGQVGERDNSVVEFLNPMQRNVSKNDLRRGINIPQELSEDLAYLCGVFAGDGSINYRKKKNEYSLKVVGNPKDEKEFYHQVIGPKFEKVFGVFPRMKYHDSRTTYGFSIYSKTIYLYLTETIGLPSGVKYSKLKIPEVFLEEEQFYISFIRGVFDTDGYVALRKENKNSNYYPHISLSSKSAKFLKEISNILKLLKFRVWEQFDRNKPDSRIKLGYTIISTIDLSGHKNFALWTDKIGFYSPKHLAKMEKHKQSTPC